MIKFKLKTMVEDKKIYIKNFFLPVRIVTGEIQHLVTMVDSTSGT